MNAWSRILIGLVALMGAWVSLGTEQAHGGYNAAADFSPNSNPNGVWSYGWSTSLGSAFNLDTINATTAGINLWEGNVLASDGLYTPFVEHNGTANTITSGTIQLAPGQLAVHPGPQDQYAVIRFTTSVAGVYDLSTSFTGLDFVGPTTTDLHVLLDGISIFYGNVDGYGPGSASSFNAILTLNAGDTIDFAVGYGSNGNFNYDTTGVSASLSSVPEPSSLILVGIAGVMVVGYGIRNRRRIGLNA